MEWCAGMLDLSSFLIFPCSGCQGNVEKTLKGLEGVQNVNVDLSAKLATVQADERFDLANAIKKVTDAGYEASEAK